MAITKNKKDREYLYPFCFLSSFPHSPYVTVGEIPTLCVALRVRLRALPSAQDDISRRYAGANANRVRVVHGGSKPPPYGCKCVQSAKPLTPAAKARPNFRYRLLATKRALVCVLRKFIARQTKSPTFVIVRALRTPYG